METGKENLLQNEYPVGYTPQAPAYPSETDHHPQSKRNGGYTMVAQHQMPGTDATISQQPGSYSQVAHAPGFQQLMPMPYTPSPLQPVPGPLSPIMIQPGATIPLGNPGTAFGWMPLPPVPEPDCPPGLEYLTTIDQLLVHQKVELLEVYTGFETANRYSVKNILGQKVFYAIEQSDCCTRNCCGSIRDFGMKIVDNYQREVIHLERPLRCQSCCCPCCLQVLEVFSPPGCLIGTVEQTWDLCLPKFDIKNAAGDTVLRIEGPFCTFNCCGGEVEFEVLSKDSDIKVGKISKQWSGLAKELFTDADNFGITFPMDLDVRMKAVMLGACFLIDMMYFEDEANQKANNNVDSGLNLALCCLNIASEIE